MKTAAAIALAALSCAGCGQKGSLYLPNQKKPVPATHSQPQPQPQSQPNSPRPTTPAGTQPPTS